MRALSCLILIVPVMVCLAATPVDGQDWPQFRGPDGAGISSLKGVPVTWTDADTAWKVDFANVGHSSPIVIGKRLFVTTATEGGAERFLHCLNADTGARMWEVSVQMNESHKHAKNSWASSTPATDGQRVYCLFADDTRLLAAAWTLSGEPAWSKELGTYESEHGLGASPIIRDGLLIVPNDQVGPSAIVALNAETGDVVWKSDRPGGKTSYSTPIVMGSAESTQLICIGEASGVTSLDLHSGTLLWQTPKLPMRTVASPVGESGLVFALCGEGGNGKYSAAIRTDAKIESASRIAWERKTTLPYVPCPVVRDGLLFLWGDKGIMVCLELATGEEVWSERIDGAFSGSPVCIEDRLYAVSEAGEVVVIHAGREFRELGRTRLGDDCHSTPAVGNGHLYIHTFHKVFAVKAAP